jgi:hypothetical protein
MGSVATFEKKGSNARGGDTEDNLMLRAQLIAQGVVEIGLASASRPMKEEYLFCLIHNSRDGPVKGSLLIWV